MSRALWLLGGQGTEVSPLPASAPHTEYQEGSVGSPRTRALPVLINVSLQNELSESRFVSNILLRNSPLPQVDPRPCHQHDSGRQLALGLLKERELSEAGSALLLPAP